MIRFLQFLISIALFSVVFSSGLQAAQLTSANVMAPLQVSDWALFDKQLATARHIGVNAVTVDVWWGLVEREADQQFNWQYYDKVFAHINAAGLGIIPIMSFHQCGGNVGDDCDIPLPPWIWQHFSQQGVSASQLKYKSEFGNESSETISLWADDYVIPQYAEFMQAFVSRYHSYSDKIPEINISLGPAGELRYPSYNSHDGGRTGYPTRGGFQAYSDIAKADFHRWLQHNYQTLTVLNQQWQTSYNRWQDITPPADGDVFINSGAQFKPGFGHDFISWYHQSLLAHGRRMLSSAVDAFTGEFSRTEIGFKIPGIHWKIASPDYSRRSAELAAGLIPSNIQYDTSNAYGYGGIVGLAAEFKQYKRDLVVHFTALEMQDNPQHASQSMAQSLVMWLGMAAKQHQVAIKGENALAAGVTSNSGWDNIDYVLANSNYSGITILRLEQVTDGGIGQRRYQHLIQQFLSKDSSVGAGP